MKTYCGYTLKQVESTMIKMEKIVAWYNKRDNFQTENIGTEKEKKNTLKQLIFGIG